MDKSKLNQSVIIHEFEIKRDDIKKKIIYHFSDVHLTESDEFSDQAELSKANELKNAWETVRKDFAVFHGESYEISQIISAKEHFQNLLEMASNGTALVMTGDITDFNGKANFRTVDHALKAFEKPFLSVCGNHEDRRDIPDGYSFSKMKEEVQVLDLGDMIIFGIDNSKREVTKKQNEELIRTFDLGKPVLIAMHIPIMTEGNREKLEKCSEYFRLNHNEATEETNRFIEIIKEYSEQVIAVFAGHLHFRNESEIAKGVTQYVASQGILGNINRYEIGV